MLWMWRFQRNLVKNQMNHVTFLLQQLCSYKKIYFLIMAHKSGRTRFVPSTLTFLLLCHMAYYPLFVPVLFFTEILAIWAGVVVLNYNCRTPGAEAGLSCPSLVTALSCHSPYYRWFSYITSLWSLPGTEENICLHFDVNPLFSFFSLVLCSPLCTDMNCIRGRA